MFVYCEEELSSFSEIARRLILLRRVDCFESFHFEINNVLIRRKKRCKQNTLFKLSNMLSELITYAEQREGALHNLSDKYECGAMIENIF